MASEVPPQRGATFDYAVALGSQANTKLFQTSVTLAAGDVKWSKAGAAFSNVTNLPAEVSTTGAIVGALTTSETDCDWGILKFSDASGAQWCDLSLTIYFSARRIDDLSYPATSGRSTAIDASGQVTVGAIATDAVDANALKADAVAEIADGVLSRGVSNVEDAADTTSLAALVLAAFESSMSGATWTIRKTGGSTFVTKTLTTDAAADPVTGVT